MDEVWIFHTQQDMETCNYANAQKLCDDQMGAAGCLVKLAKTGTLFLASGMLGYCRRNLKVGRGAKGSRPCKRANWYKQACWSKMLQSRIPESVPELCVDGPWGIKS